MKSTRVYPLFITAIMLASATAWAGGDPAAGESKASGCAGCHGAEGEGLGENPSIAGMDKAAFAEAMNAYKKGMRDDPTMQMFAAQLSDEDIADLAAYYASLGGE